MQELVNVKWILGISLVMFFLSVWLVPSLLYIPYYPPSTRTAWDTFWYYVNRVDVLLFIATITTAALFTAGYGKNTLMHRLTVSFFLVSMALLFLTFLRPLLTPP
jgi:hypothetical protein